MSVRQLNAERTKHQIDYYIPGTKVDKSGNVKPIRKRLTFFGSESEAVQLELELRRKNINVISANPLCARAPFFFKGVTFSRHAKAIKTICFNASNHNHLFLIKLRALKILEQFYSESI